MAIKGQMLNTELPGFTARLKVGEKVGKENNQI